MIVERDDLEIAVTLREQRSDARLDIQLLIPRRHQKRHSRPGRTAARNAGKPRQIAKILQLDAKKNQ